jgi:hypothetical protein
MKLSYRKSSVNNHTFSIIFRWLILTVSLLLLAGCSSEDSPEDLVKQFLDTAEIAIEQGELGKVRELIADDYTDSQSRTKKELLNYLAYQVLRKQAIHLYTSVKDITFPTPQTGAVEMFVAMSGAPADSKRVLLDLQADIYRFEISLRAKGPTWEVTSANWEPAMLDELFPQ